MSIPDPAFTEFTQTSGTLRMKLMGDVQEIDHESTCYLGPDGIGCAEMAVDGKVNYLFLSNTPDGAVMTMVGEEDGLMDLEVEGYARLVSANSDADFATAYALHREALEGLEVLDDEAWLKAEVPRLGQRATDVMAILIPRMMGMMEDMMQGFGDAMEGLAEGLGRAMEGMAEGMAKAFGGEEIKDAEVEEDLEKLEE